MCSFFIYMEQDSNANSALPDKEAHWAIKIKDLVRFQIFVNIIAYQSHTDCWTVQNLV